jgi:ComF family protein
MAIGDTFEAVTQAEATPLAGASRSGAPGKLRAAVSRSWHRMLDLILPPVCLGCGERMVAHDCLCPACWRTIDFIRPPLCDRLGIPLPYDTGGPMVSAAAEADPPDYDRARAVAAFTGLMRDLVHGLKFSDKHDGRRLFGRWLMTSGGDLLADADVIVPVPLSRWRLLSRRFNQAQILAAELGRLTGKPVAAQVLIRRRRTRSQVGLSRTERHKSVGCAFAVQPKEAKLVYGKSVLLNDDVITTGATVSAAARVLKKAGAARVDVLALGLVVEPGHAG